MAPGAGRVAELQRETKETRITLRLDLDGSGAAEVDTGVPFFDHMLDQLARHAPLVASIPVRIILDDRIAVRGAASVALRGLGAANAAPAVPAPRS